MVADVWATGLSPDSHPAAVRPGPSDRASGALADRRRCPRVDDGPRVLVGGVVTHRQRPATAGGITFLNLEDETGMLNVVCSTAVWQRYRRVARESRGAGDPRAAGAGRRRDQPGRRAHRQAGALGALDLPGLPVTGPPPAPGFVRLSAARPAVARTASGRAVSRVPLRWRLADDPAADAPGQGSLFSSDDLMTTERGTGRLSGMEFLHVHARRIINEVPAASRMPFRYTINAYRGCSHACTYCFARPTHDYLGLNIGDDFERRHRGQGQRGRAAAGRAAQSEVDRRVDRDGHEHRPVPAVRGEIPADPRDRRGAGRGAQPVLGADQVGAGPARPRPAGRGGAAHRRVGVAVDRDAGRGGVAGHRARRAAPAAAGGRGAPAGRGRDPDRRAGRAGAARACPTRRRSWRRW